MFAIKAAVGKPRKRLRHTIFVFASENEGGQGLVACGIVASAEATPKKPGAVRQTPRVSITIRRIARAKRRLGRSELKPSPTGTMVDRRPSSTSSSIVKATNKIVGISDAAVAFLREFF